MPFDTYRHWLSKYGFQDIPPIEENPKIHKLFNRDIADSGETSIKTIDISNFMKCEFDNCIYCMECINNCPENALSLNDNEFNLRSDLCLGLGCLRCVGNCKQNAFKYNKFYKEIIE